MGFQHPANVPAYVVAHIAITDTHRYEDYKRLVLDTLTPFGGRFLVRGATPEVLEGAWDPKRLVLLEFPDAEHARRWWASPEYAAARAIRQATSDGTLVLLEGVRTS
jgi:uncharacterized protein (DUF1330 family)